ncbi:MAG: hypothetical protein QM673_02930 [Gordonia sp. (in: high G+C Gram-positive bacteria)]
MTALTDKVRFTVAATEYLSELIRSSDRDGIVFRISAPPAGCEIPACTGQFDLAPRCDDAVATIDGLTVVIDPASLQALEPTLVDVVSTASGIALRFRAQA